MKSAGCRVPTTAGRMVLLAVALASSSLASGQSIPAVSPPVWAMIGDGISLTQGGHGYKGTVTQMPTIGAGMRVTQSSGFEASLLLSRSFDRQNLAFGDPRPYSPNYGGITGSYLLIRGSPSLPFSAVLGLGGGAYRETGHPNTELGLHAFIDEAVKGTRAGTFDGQVRVNMLPSSSAGRTVSLALIVVFRTATKVQLH